MIRDAAPARRPAIPAGGGPAGVVHLGSTPASTSPSATLPTIRTGVRSDQRFWLADARGCSSLLPVCRPPVAGGGQVRSWVATEHPPGLRPCSAAVRGSDARVRLAGGRAMVTSTAAPLTAGGQPLRAHRQRATPAAVAPPEPVLAYGVARFAEITTKSSETPATPLRPTGRPSRRGRSPRSFALWCSRGTGTRA